LIHTKILVIYRDVHGDDPSTRIRDPESRYLTLMFDYSESAFIIKFPVVFFSHTSNKIAVHIV